jgi:MFS family permease
VALLLDRLFSSVALSHLAVDLVNGQRGIFLAYLSIPLGLTNAAVGLVSTIYAFAASLSQPLFGFLSDRLGARWVVAGGVLWMMSFFTLALFAQSAWALVFLVIASVGSGAFHPAGSAQATALGRNHLAGREATAASYFFVFGQAGYFFGPLAGGPLLDRFGPPGLLVIAAACLPISLFAGWELRRLPVPQVRWAGSPLKIRSPLISFRAPASVVVALVLVAAFQSWIQQSMNTFLPKYLADLGQPASVYGAISGIYMGGYALGNLAGGNLADRIGRRRVIITSMLLSFLPLSLIAYAQTSFWLYILVFLAGLMTGSAFTVIVVIGQGMLPGGEGLASGLILGFLFSAGALGVLGSGYLADLFGFQAIFYLSGLLALLASLAAIGLQRDKTSAIVV